MSVRNVIRVLTFLGLVGGVPGYALAQEQPGIGVVSTLIGEATVARGTTTQPLALKTRDDVFMQDRISTKERSLVHEASQRPHECSLVLLRVRPHARTVAVATDEAAREKLLQDGRGAIRLVVRQVGDRERARLADRPQQPIAIGEQRPGG